MNSGDQFEDNKGSFFLCLLVCTCVLRLRLWRVRAETWHFVRIMLGHLQFVLFVVGPERIVGSTDSEKLSTNHKPAGEAHMTMTSIDGTPVGRARSRAVHCSLEQALKMACR